MSSRMWSAGAGSRPQAVEPPPEPEALPTFWQYAEQWWTLKAGQIEAGTQTDYRSRLEVHLVPYFGEMTLDAITSDTVGRFIAAKLADGLAPRTVNMQTTLLGAILERAVEHELIPRNPARGKGRKVRERARKRSYLDSAAQIVVFLNAAGEQDSEAPASRKHIERRAMIATLIYAGPRIEEMLALRWRDVDLADGWLHVRGTKSDEADRKVKIRGALRDELLALRGRNQEAPQTGFVFPTSTGRKLSQDNFRRRVLGRAARTRNGEEEAGKGAIGRANEWLEADGLPPLPDRLTPQSMRCTFASILYALGETPPVVMQEIGHSDAGLALKVYAQAMRRGDAEKAALRGLVEGAQLAHIGSPGDSEAEDAPVDEAA